MGHETLVRTPAQARFHFLKERSGLKAGEIAKLLGLTPGAVSHYLSDDPKKRRNPSSRVLDLFAHKLEDLPEEPYHNAVERMVTADAPEVAEATDQLRELHENNPDGFRAATAVIATFYGKPNSRTKRAATALAGVAASKAQSASRSRKQRP